MSRWDIQTILKVGGAIVTSLIAATSFGFNSFSVKPNAHWSLIAFISFLAFVFFVFWGWFGEARRVRQLEEARPHIEVIPTKRNRYYYLEVKNTGHVGDFNAQVTVTIKTGYNSNLIGKSQTHMGYWLKARSNKATILNNDSDEIIVAHLEKVKPPETPKTDAPPITERILEIFYYNPDVQKGGFSSPIPPNLSSWYSPSWTLQDESTPKPEYLLQVSIGSDPALLTPFTKNYILSGTGLVEEPITFRRSRLSSLIGFRSVHSQGSDS
jgi:hypothetical protein